jgi:hypothetical protein
MKFHLPLYARISGWFLLNILLIGVVVFFFTRQHFSLDNLVAGPAGDRITTLAKLTGENLRTHNETDWPDLLASLEDHHPNILASKMTTALPVPPPPKKKDPADNTETTRQFRCQ